MQEAIEGVVRNLVKERSQTKTGAAPIAKPQADQVGLHCWGYLEG
jgi:hypothetical protein